MSEQEFDDLRYPSRKPWLIAIIVIIVGVVLFQCLKGKRSSSAADEVPSEGKQAGQKSSLIVGTPPKMESNAATAQAGSIKTSAASKMSPARPVVQAAATKESESPRTTKQAGPQQPSGAVLVEAKAAEDSGDLLKARSLHMGLLKAGLSSDVLADVESRLGRINIELATTPAAWPEFKIDYIVKKGDSVQKIAKTLNTTVDLVQKANEMANPDLIKAGDRLKILTGKFSITVSRKRNDMVLALNGEFFKRYRVATGKYDKTPPGSYVITAEKMKDPPWTKRDSGRVEIIPPGATNNLLGSRWMAIDATGSTPAVEGYGIHGTIDEESIGRSETAGCVRMKNADVEELFMLVTPGTPVNIGE